MGVVGSGCGRGRHFHYLPTTSLSHDYQHIVHMFVARRAGAHPGTLTRVRARDGTGAGPRIDGEHRKASRRAPRPGGRPAPRPDTGTACPEGSGRPAAEAAFAGPFAMGPGVVWLGVVWLGVDAYARPSGRADNPAIMTVRARRRPARLAFISRPGRQSFAALLRGLVIQPAGRCRGAVGARPGRRSPRPQVRLLPQRRRCSRAVPG